MTGDSSSQRAEIPQLGVDGGTEMADMEDGGRLPDLPTYPSRLALLQVRLG